MTEINQTIYEDTKRIERLIREEYTRLDGLTHLNGAELPIIFEYIPQVFGDFNARDMRFCFSLRSFTDSQNMLDNIRHQYAHYMSRQLYGAIRPHGPEWKKCCVIVNAIPLPWLYRREEEETTTETKVFTDTENRYVTALILPNRRDAIGCAVLHPKFGYGLITDITCTCKGSQWFARVYFGDSGSKQIDLGWIKKHGRIFRAG